MRRSALLLLAAMLVVPLAQAQPKWAELSPQEQEQFARFASDWDTMPADRKLRIIENHERWKHMSPEERAEARKKFAKFKSMPADQRDALRDCYRRKRAGEAIECPKPTRK